jgi:hypothetical protein
VSITPPRPFRPTATHLGRWLARPQVFDYLHKTLALLAFLPQLASWFALRWWEAGKVPKAHFQAWDTFFTTWNQSGIYPWLGLLATTLYAALVLRKAKDAVLGVFVLVASFILMSLGISLVGYD